MIEIDYDDIYNYLLKMRERLEVHTIIVNNQLFNDIYFWEKNIEEYLSVRGYKFTYEDVGSVFDVLLAIESFDVTMHRGDFLYCVSEYDELK
jgi:hypothetical protein